MHPMHPMHPMQPYINLYLFLIQVYPSMHPMHPMQLYMNLYIFSYTSLCIYASMHPMQMIKLVFNSIGLISCLVSDFTLSQTSFHITTLKESIDLAIARLVSSKLFQWFAVT